MAGALDRIKAVGTLGGAATAVQSDEWQGEAVCEGARQAQKQEGAAIKTRQLAFRRLNGVEMEGNLAGE